MLKPMSGRGFPWDLTHMLSFPSWRICFIEGFTPWRLIEREWRDVELWKNRMLLGLVQWVQGDVGTSIFRRKGELIADLCSISLGEFVCWSRYASYWLLFVWCGNWSDRRKSLFWRWGTVWVKRFSLNWVLIFWRGRFRNWENVFKFWLWRNRTNTLHQDLRFDSFWSLEFWFLFLHRLRFAVQSKPFWKPWLFTITRFPYDTFNPPRGISYIWISLVKRILLMDLDSRSTLWHS